MASEAQHNSLIKVWTHDRDRLLHVLFSDPPVQWEQRHVKIHGAYRKSTWELRYCTSWKTDECPTAAMKGLLRELQLHSARASHIDGQFELSLSRADYIEFQRIRARGLSEEPSPWEAVPMESINKSKNPQAVVVGNAVYDAAFGRNHGPRWKKDHLTWTYTTERIVDGNGQSLADIREATERVFHDRLLLASVDYDRACAKVDVEHALAGTDKVKVTVRLPKHAYERGQYKADQNRESDHPLGEIHRLGDSRGR